MKNRFFATIDAFALGMCLEYIVRVEASIYPIVISVVLFISILLDFYMDYINKQHYNLIKDNLNIRLSELESESAELTVPKGWMVYESGQDPIHMLWYVNLIHFDDLANKYVEKPRQSYSEEHDSYEDALKNAISGIKDCESEK